MARQVDNITLYENGYAFINDAEGSIVYHPHIDVTTMETPPKVPAGLISDETLVRYTFEGVEKEAVWLPLENGTRLNVTVPVSEIDAGWHSWIKEIIGVSIVLLAIFILITTQFSSHITKPLRELTLVAERVNEGDYDCVPDHRGTDEGRCGEIRFVCANRQLRESLGPAYRDGTLYEDLIPKNPRFEDFCFHSAVLGQRGHVYVEVPWLGCWAEEIAIPLNSGDDRRGFCQITIEFTRQADADRLSAVSMSTAQAALNASITLMSADDFREGVETVLYDTMMMSEAQISRLFLLDKRSRSVSVYCRAISPIYPHRENNTLNYDLLSTWEQSVGGANSLIISNEQDLAALEKNNPKWAASLRSFGVRTLALIPLRRGKELYGYVDFVNFDARKIAEVKDLVEFIAIYLGAEVSNHILMARLEEASTTDALTGLKNRSAMLRRMDTMGDACFGIVNLDLNGLKIVNDTQGHDAGDRLLVTAAEALTKVFYHDDVFRTGGDEFIILIPGISRDRFDAKLTRFRLAMDKSPELSFAMGACWSDGSESLPAAFRRADDAMYADKRVYYRRHPERRRRD